jgi:hypothetical protein
MKPPSHRRLGPAHGAIIDHLAGVRCLVHSHHSDRSGRRLQIGASARAGRYDVVSRTPLVVLGLRDDWISFDEALDPRGFDPSLG